MDSERVIDMTEEELIEANLKALGLSSAAAGKKLDDAVYDYFVSYAREHRQLPIQADVAKHFGVNQSTISQSCKRLVDARRMIQTPITATGRMGYLPIVTTGATK